MNCELDNSIVTMLNFQILIIVLGYTRECTCSQEIYSKVLRGKGVQCLQH